MSDARQGVAGMTWHALSARPYHFNLRAAHQCHGRLTRGAHREKAGGGANRVAVRHALRCLCGANRARLVAPRCGSSRSRRSRRSRASLKITGGGGGDSGGGMRVGGDGGGSSGGSARSGTAADPSSRRRGRGPLRGRGSRPRLEGEGGVFGGERRARRTQ